MARNCLEATAVDVTKIYCKMLRKRPRVGCGVGTGDIVTGGSHTSR